MFSGLIEQVSKVNKISYTDNGAVISFYANFDDIKIGDSIAVNGVCLTVCKIEDNLIYADIMNETLKITILKQLKQNDKINLERALKFQDRLNGHIVSGHIDCCARVVKIFQDGFAKKVRFNCNSDLIVEKGSIAINGVSLTVCEIYDDGFEVSLIPETQNKTNLIDLKINDEVNIEYDILAKYVKKFIQPQKKNQITEEFLRKNGF